MKKTLLTILLIPVIWFAMAQADNPNHSRIPASNVYNAAYVKALYAKYPTQKSDFCPACRLWVNPYYTSIADTVKNYPVIEHVMVTSDNVKQQEAANIPRKGVYEGWNITKGARRLDAVYSYANSTLKKPIEFAYGHDGLCWILAARDANGAIMSNTETYGEFMEWQGQNVGTMIATEDTTRLLLGATLNGVKHPVIADQVEIWSGCVSNVDAKNPSKVYTVKDVSVTVPDVVWKVIRFNGQTVCYWMPNINSEVKALLPKRHISYDELVKRLGFDPEQVLH